MPSFGTRHFRSGVSDFNAKRAPNANAFLQDSLQAATEQSNWTVGWHPQHRRAIGRFAHDRESLANSRRSPVIPGRVVSAHFCPATAFTERDRIAATDPEGSRAARDEAKSAH